MQNRLLRSLLWSLLLAGAITGLPGCNGGSGSTSAVPNAVTGVAPSARSTPPQKNNPSCLNCGPGGSVYFH